MPLRLSAFAVKKFNREGAKALRRKEMQKRQ